LCRSVTVNQVSVGLPLTVQEKNRRGKGDERKSGDGVKRHNKSDGDKINEQAG
jgi:hypothetical protein